MSKEEDWKLFSDDFDQAFAVGPDEGNAAYFGRNVLRGLVDGIKDFVAERQPRWRRFHSGPALLGSAPWVDDDEFLATLGRLAACVVMTKQTKTNYQLRKLERLREVNSKTPGMPVQALPELGGMAPKEDGKPAVVGPSTPLGEGATETIRTLGYRKHGSQLVPIVHAKLVVLGHLWWSDEGPLGHVEDVIGFKPLRLWVSSANLTRSSRGNLEFGLWTEDTQLVDGATRFLERLISASEGLDPESDNPEPDLAPFEFDDVAMAEAAAEASVGRRR